MPRFVGPNFNATSTCYLFYKHNLIGQNINRIWCCISSSFSLSSVEMQSSLLNLGLGVGFIPGMFYDRFGPTWTSVVGLVISLTGYMLLWSTTKLQAFYRPRSWLMGILFFLTGTICYFTCNEGWYLVVSLSEKGKSVAQKLPNAFTYGTAILNSLLFVLCILWDHRGPWIKNSLYS